MRSSEIKVGACAATLRNATLLFVPLVVLCDGPCRAAGRRGGSGSSRRQTAGGGQREATATVVGHAAQCSAADRCAANGCAAHAGKWWLRVVNGVSSGSTCRADDGEKKKSEFLCVGRSVGDATAATPQSQKSVGASTEQSHLRPQLQSPSISSRLSRSLSHRRPTMRTNTQTPSAFSLRCFSPSGSLEYSE